MCGEQLQRAGNRERRRVSVVFIDLTAFTTLTLGFDPEELRDLADEVLTVVAGVIEDYDGYVDAFRGDGLIALFGAPRSHPDDPQRAVLAAAAGLRAIETIGRAKGYPLKGRAGVNTGIVIAGSVGSGKVRDYTVMGSTVNLAARLEAAAIPGEVWVGPETYESTRHRLVFERSPQIRLAGFPNVRYAYRLVSTVEQHDADPYAHLELVGRDGQLQQLEERLTAAVETGTTGMLWLLGEAGSGKTRLVREFTRRVSQRGVRVVRLAGGPGEGHAWRQLSRQLLGLQDGEEPRVQQQKALQALQELLPGEVRRHQLLLASLGLAELTDRTGVGPGTVNRTLATVWRDVVKAAAEAAPQGMLMTLDGGMFDPQLHELVRSLEEVRSPLLIVRTSREGEPPEGQEAIILGALDMEASLALLNQLANPILRDAAALLVRQVSGVPAYLIELGRALSSTRSGTFSGSLASLLQARLDLLAPRERQLLSLAAVAGERSWERMLLDLAEGAGDAELQRILREGLLVIENSSSIPGHVSYRFQSELLRHAVLRMIPFGDRPVLHLRIASWLEQHAPLALSELIGDHFRDGESPEAAYPHYLAAADFAASQGDPRASELYGKLLSLDLPAELEAQAMLAYAQAAFSMGLSSVARDLLERVEPLLGEVEQGARPELLAARRSLLADLGAADDEWQVS